MKQVLLIPIDLLLDTRLPTLSLIDSAVAESIVLDKVKGQKYRDRLNDQFIEFGLEKDKFSEMYAKRKADILRYSRPTRFLFELPTIADQLIKKSLMEPHNAEEIEFHINFYPYYQLTDIQREYIVGAVKARVQDLVKFKAVYIPDRKLSANMIKSNAYTGLFFYDYSQWVNTFYGTDVQQSELMQMPSVSVYSGVSFNDLDKLKVAIEFRNDEGQQCDPLMGLRAMWLPYFYFESIDSASLSIIDPDELVDKEIQK